MCVLVGVNTPKDQAEGSIVEKSSTATTVAGSEAGDANQAPNGSSLHRIDRDASGDVLFNIAVIFVPSACSEFDVSLGASTPSSVCVFRFLAEVWLRNSSLGA